MGSTDHGRAEVRAVGDVFLDRKHPENTFELVQSKLDEADLLVGNFEGSLSNAGEQAKFRPWSNFLYSPPEMIAGVKEAGFDVLSLANNQSMNYGPTGLLDTLELFSKQRIGVVGAGIDQKDAEEVYTKTVNGVDIGILAFESTWWDWKATQAGPDRPGLNQIAISPYFGPPYVSEFDLEKMTAQIKAAARNNDVLLTLFHFGIAGEYQHTRPQTELAHRAIDSGADVVIGAHSHTLQAVEMYGGSPIFYSLGNFAFDRPQTWSLDVMPSESAMLNLTVEGDGVSKAVLHPAVYDYGARNRPSLLTPETEKYTEIAEHLQQLSKRTGTSLEVEATGIRVPV